MLAFWKYLHPHSKLMSNSNPKKVVIAAFLGSTWIEFDFFLLVFVLKDVAAEFHVAINYVAFAIMLTLMMRPVILAASP